MKKKGKKRKLRVDRIYDLFIIFVYIIAAILMLFALRKYTLKFLFAGLLILVLILAIYILSLFLNNKFIEYTRRIFLTLLCIVLFFGYTQLNSINQFFDNLTKQDENQTIVTQMDLLSLDDSEVFTAIVREMDDIEGKKVAINAMSDKYATKHVQDRLDELYKNIEYIEYSDYTTMVTDLFYGYVDVICFNTAHQSAAENAWGPLKDFTIKLHSYTIEEELEISKNEKDITKEVFSVLISANDEIGAPANFSKSDANMLVIINPNTHQMIMVSIPRDAFIANPAYGNIADKLTHTGNNGVENTRIALENALGIDIDFYVKVSFSSVIEIIDALGEIEVNVPIAFCEQDENRSFAVEDEICLNVGKQTLDGREALAFARHRHSYINQDIGRNEAQMQVIKGVVKQLLTAEGISKIDDILDIIPTYVLTNFSNVQIQSFIKSQIDDLKPWTMTTLSLANGLYMDNVPTASMPTVGSTVYYLNKNEVYKLQCIFKSFEQKNTLENFNFSLNNLYNNGDKFKGSKYTEYYDPTLYN